MPARMGKRLKEMGNTVNENTENEATQGQHLGAIIANSALEHTVSSYLIGVGEILRQVADAARGLDGDGFTLSDFADLLEGKDAA